MTSPTIPKLKRDWVGRYVRLKHQVKTGHGAVFEAGEVMQVTRNYGGLRLEALYECGECFRRHHRYVTKVCEESVELIPLGFEPATFPTRAELAEHCKELSSYVHYLLEEGKLYGPWGYTFPDGALFERPGE